MSTPTPLTIITKVNVGPSILGGNGSGPIIKAWAFPAFNPIIELSEEICSNY